MPTAIRRGNGLMDLRAYPQFLCITATFSAAAFVAAALSSRAGLRCLLALSGTAAGQGLARDEAAESRALLAMLAGAGAAGTTLTAALLLQLPMTVALPAFLFVLLLGGSLAATHARASAAVASLDVLSPLRARLEPRVSLLRWAYTASVLSLSITLVMSMRASLLDAMIDRRYGHGAGVGAAVIDRALLVGPWLLTLLGTASFWLPVLAMPRGPDDGAALPTFPRARRVGLVFALLSVALLLRMEDFYERRVAPARENLIAQEEKAKDG
jgi:hypothetical protein